MNFQPLAISCVWLCIFLSIPADGIEIEFYRHDNYTDLMYQSSSTARCNNFSEPNFDYPRSIITDTCLMVYYYKGCNSRSKKILPGKAQYALPESFHVCNAEEGGPELNVDITKLYVEGKRWQAPEILESYKNMCSCVNIPQYVQNMANWSISNHGNDLLAYYATDCSDTTFSPLFIPAGNSEDSWGIYRENIQDGNTTYTIQSFGPALNSTYSASCLPSGALRYWMQRLASKNDRSTTLVKELQANLSVLRSFAEQLDQNVNQLNHTQTNNKHYIDDKL